MTLRVGQAGAQRAGDILRSLGAVRIATAVRPADNVRVALLHDVGDDQLAAFREMLEMLLVRRQPITPDELLAMYAHPDPPRGMGQRLALTFDDGLLSSFAATRSILDPLGLKAAFFVPTAILEHSSEEQMRTFCIRNMRAGSNPSPDRYRTMQAEHLLELRDRGHAVFPHTHSHMTLSKIDTPELIDRELRSPRAILEDLLGEPAPALALPFGDDRSVGPIGYRAIENTYDLCFTSIPGTNSSRTNPLHLHRDGFDPSDPNRHVRNLVDGALDAPYTIKMWRLQRRSRWVHRMIDPHDRGGHLLSGAVASGTAI